MIEGLLALLLCQLAGTVLSSALHLAVPGPVVGMLILLVLLRWRRPAPDAPVMRAAGRILQDLPLLFIPAGVGLVVSFTTVRQHGLLLGLGLVLPWVAGILATVGVARLVLDRQGSVDEKLGSEADQLVADAELMDGLER